MQDLVKWMRSIRYTAKEPESLQILYLLGYNLVSVPSTIGLLTSLTKIHLCINHLSTIPPEIGDLKFLKKLCLNKNNLLTLPPEIKKLTSLKKLILYANRLSAIPLEIGKLVAENRLIHVDLRGNNLEISEKFDQTYFCRFLYRLHKHILIKKYYYKWRSIVIAGKTTPLNDYEIYILQTYVALYSTA